MKTKPLELLTLDTLKPGHYFNAFSYSKSIYTYFVKHKAFSTVTQEITNYYSSNVEKNRPTLHATQISNITIPAKIGPKNYIPVSISALDSSIHRLTLLEIEEKFPGLRKVIMSHLNPDFIPLYNKALEIHVEEYRKDLDRKLANLRTIYVNYKTDLRLLDVADTMCYCEAQKIIDTIYTRINKRSSAKSIILSQALDALEDTQRLECIEG